MDWPRPFSSIEDDAKAAFEDEVRDELKVGHRLFGLPIVAIGRLVGGDDVLFQINDGSGRVAQVHVSWAGEEERPPWPSTSIFSSLAEWACSVEAEYS